MNTPPGPKIGDHWVTLGIGKHNQRLDPMGSESESIGMSFFLQQETNKKSKRIYHVIKQLITSEGSTLFQRSGTDVMQCCLCVQRYLIAVMYRRPHSFHRFLPTRVILRLAGAALFCTESCLKNWKPCLKISRLRSFCSLSCPVTMLHPGTSMISGKQA